jgi:hypothetical protein
MKWSYWSVNCPGKLTYLSGKVLPFYLSQTSLKVSGASITKHYRSRRTPTKDTPRTETYIKKAAKKKISPVGELCCNRTTSYNNSILHPLESLELTLRTSMDDQLHGISSATAMRIYLRLTMVSKGIDWLETRYWLTRKRLELVWVMLNYSQCNALYFIPYHQDVSLWLSSL